MVVVERHARETCRQRRVHIKWRLLRLRRGDELRGFDGGMGEWLATFEDDRVLAHSFSSEFSFPSSHAQLAAALATFFVRASAHPQAPTTPPAPRTTASAAAAS